MQIGFTAGAALSLADVPACNYEAQFHDDTVLQAVCALLQNLREVLLLYYYQELSTPEIANLLHLPRNVITSRLSRAVITDLICCPASPMFTPSSNIMMHP